MLKLFEELDFQRTPLGDISLRRRSELRLDGLILYEVLLNDEFLMSSLFTEAEQQLAISGLATLEEKNMDVIVGGLGLGYTAMAALENPNVKTLKVIEVMEAVINWHQQGLVPLGHKLISDPRCRLLHADFFKWATSDSSSSEPSTDQLYHAILLDIDHSPRHWLNEGNNTFYTVHGLSKLCEKLHSGGLFGLWSNDPPDDEFMKLLDNVFESSEMHIINFPNPYNGDEASNTVYFAYKG
jgi:spermidine synthase